MNDIQPAGVPATESEADAMRGRVLIVPREPEAEKIVAATMPIAFAPLAPGEKVDLGHGPQEVRFVVKRDGHTFYELSRPNGKTPLQTVSHATVERIARGKQGRVQGGNYGAVITATVAALGMVDRRLA